VLGFLLGYARVRLYSSVDASLTSLGGVQRRVRQTSHISVAGVRGLQVCWWVGASTLPIARISFSRGSGAAVRSRGIIPRA
jgi:hypothetical protein